MSNYMGDFDTGSRIDFDFTTVDSTGAPFALSSGSACVRQIGVSTGLSTVAPVGVAAITTSGGLNHVTVFTGSSSVYYVANADYHVYLGNGTVNSVSVIGYAIGHFSIMNRAQPATSEIATATEIAAAVWSLDATGYQTQGTFGQVLGDSGADTDSVWALANTNLDAAVSTRATPAQVNTEVLDVLNVDTFAQPGQGTPASTTTIRLMLNYLYKAWRNRTTQTATETALYNDDAATVDQKAAFSDNGTTADRGEISTGP